MGGGPYGTRQGAYLVTPSGILLGSTTLRGAEDVASVIRSALEKWKAMPREQRLRKDLPDPRGASARRERRAYPDDGLVLDMYSRDLPGLELSKARSQSWNQDHVWFTGSEAASLVPEASVGARRAAPEPLLRRLAMLHFIDVTHGLRYGDPPFYAPEDEVKVALTSTVEQVEGGHVELRLEGTTHTRSKRPPAARGVDTRVLGHATWDLARKRFVSFELVALGTRWGANWLGDRNDRAQESGPQPIGYALSLAGSAPRDHIAPEYLEWYDSLEPRAQR